MEMIQESGPIPNNEIMKTSELSRGVKLCYAISIGAFLCAIVFYLLGHDSIGAWVAICAVAWAVGVASVNGHLTSRPPRKDD